MPFGIWKIFVVILSGIILAIEKILHIPKDHTKRFLCLNRESQAQE
jgi:hypothetical protein